MLKISPNIPKSSEKIISQILQANDKYIVLKWFSSISKYFLSIFPTLVGNSFQ